MQSLQKMLMMNLHVVVAVDDVDDAVQRRDLLIRLLDIEPCLQVDRH